MNQVDPDEDTWKKGATTFGAFLLFGSVPVWVYIICRGLVSSDTTFIISIVGTLFTIFMLGVCQGVITKQPLIWR
jgi:VIT1/CCC1 family predicted Fe2+/Mn2+ transporter